MPSAIEYGQLAARVYNRTQRNRVSLPQGWEEVKYFSDRERTFSGFSAGVYRNDDQIVISYTGTNEKQIVDFIEANIPAAVGMKSAQVSQAMLLYLKVLEENPNANISFTGHSLGGGLASLMAVYFDRPATVFDPAPFEASARLASGLLLEYRGLMQSFGYSNPEFNTLAGSLTADEFLRREQAVDSIEVKGEVLTLGRTALTTIMGSRTILPVGQQDVGAVDLHSITLLNLLMQSTEFASAVQALPNSLQLFFDKQLYATDPQASEQFNFLDRLLNLNSPASGSTGYLDKFAADLTKVSGNAGIAQGNQAVKNAMIVAAMEYYYFKDASSATSLFTQAGNAIHFKFSDIGASQYKSLPILAKAVGETLAAGEKDYVQNLLRRDAWHIQSGDGPMTFTAAGNDSNAIIGGDRDDMLTGGSSIDNIIGGKGNDTLDGGASADILVGGVGDDILEGSQGRDTISDLAGNNLFSGGIGADTITGGNGNNVFIGGTTNDSIVSGSGDDLFAFNAGDGDDLIRLGGGNDTLSLGGGIDYADLALSKQGDDLRLHLGNGDTITFDEWYTSNANQSLVNLQVIAESMGSYNPAGTDTLRDNKVESFDFRALVEKFEAAREANPRLNKWNMANSLLSTHLGGSDSAALGGDFAYQYGTTGSLANMSVDAAQALLANAQLNVNAQQLQAVAALQAGGTRLM